MASITFEAITKRWGDVVAVNDLHLDVEDKEFLILVGPSGCGKSTTLRMLAGLEVPTEGDIFIGNNLVNDVPPKDRDIAMVFQSYALYPHMTVYDNMAFGLKLRGTPKAEIDQRVQSASQELGIDQLLDRKPRQLSGGQRQRVAVGRAIVREPQVFLMDEPLSNLDAKLRVEARAMIQRLYHRLKTTFIYVTHDQVEAMTMGTRIVVMQDGRVMQVDSPQVLFDEPANIFVAGFIGSPSMNFFKATLEELDGDLYVQTDLFSVKAPERHQASWRNAPNRDVILGIRPGDIHDPAFTPPGVIAVEIEAQVDVIERMGDEIVAWFLYDDVEFVGRIDPRSAVTVGNNFTMVMDAYRMHLFDAVSGVAIREFSNGN